MSASKRQKKDTSPVLSKEGINVGDLFSLIPKQLFDSLRDELKADKWIKHFSAENLFKLLLFSSLKNDKLSLRTLASDYDDAMFRILIDSLDDKSLSWVAVRDRLIGIPLTYFERIYAHVYEQTSRLYSESALAKLSLKRFDSTMIAVSSHLFEGMQVGNSTKKHQVKLTTEYKDDLLPWVKFYDNQEHLSEEVALKEVIISKKHTPEELIVFDSGLKARDTFEQLQQQEVKFVTRAMQKPRFEPAGQNPEQLTDHTEELELVNDLPVRLFSSGHKKNETVFRLIEYKKRDKNESLFFITNVNDLKASTIAQAYRKRWDIEVLFRFLKQEINLNHFVSYDKNAMQVLIYLRLILAMMILIYKKKNHIESFKQAKKEFYQELTYDMLLLIIENPVLSIELKQYILKIRRQHDKNIPDNQAP